MNPLPKAAILHLFWPVSDPVPVVAPPPRPERQPTSSPALERLRSALAAVPNDGEGLDYDRWRNVLFALHDATEGSDEGLALAHEFSARSHKYDAQFLDTRFWPYAGKRADDVVPADYLFTTAQQYGWQDPDTVNDFDALPDAPAPSRGAKFAFVQAAQFSAGRPPGWIIKGVLPRAELVVLYGESGAGKSFLALDIMGAVARGVDWCGHRTAQGLHCGYIAAEGAAGFRLRLQAYAQHHGVSLDALALSVLTGAPNFMEKADVVDLGKAMLDGGPIDVLVVDTLAQVTPGANENAGEDMGRVIKHCKTLHQVTGATIVLVHHSGKDASRGARGWSGIKGALDAELEVTRAENDRVVTVSKMKDGQGEGRQYGFRLLEVPLGMDDDGDVYGSCVVEHTTVSAVVKRGGPRGKHEQAVYRAALNLVEVDGEAPTIDAVVAEYLAQTPADPLAKRDLRKQHAERALRGLVDRGLLEVEGVRVAMAAAKAGVTPNV